MIPSLGDLDSKYPDVLICSDELCLVGFQSLLAPTLGV